MNNNTLHHPPICTLFYKLRLTHTPTMESLLQKKKSCTGQKSILTMKAKAEVI